jgi:hypothetical protein
VAASAGAPQAFINMPYARSYERVYLAFISGLAGYGMVPTAAVYDPSSRFQLERIIDLIAAADYSFHDLSYMGQDPAAPQTPRFNMPFELGIAVTSAKFRNNKHKWFVFDTQSHRVHKACSDLGGVNVRIHDKSAESVLKCLMNALSREGPRPSYENLLDIYADVARVAKKIKRDFDLFDTSPFAELSYAAVETAERLVAKAQRVGAT